MLMKDVISVAAGFQYSVNIDYDLGNDEKLKNFIPTKSALNLLEDILLSVNADSSERARILIGAYGKGKSHIVLAILSILMHKDLNIFEKLLPALEKNPVLFQLVKDYYSYNKKILPIIIGGNSANLTQAFLLALQQTLSKNNLLDIMPRTNYKAAIKVLARWKKKFPETLKNFQSRIKEPLESFIARLENFETSAYQKFEKLYSQVTAGSTFNPFVNFDVPEIFESVAKSLQEKGYAGIFVVYDEFSKYLESNIKNTSNNETKMLQDFAEKCARSGALQMHLLLISHKEISNYIDALPKEKIDGWRGLSERFQHVHFYNTFTQYYEIISAAILHNPKLWRKFQYNRRFKIAALYQQYENHKIFKEVSGEIKSLVVNCYPLHPVSIFILPRLSEKVAQNERTLFTFLSAKGTFTFSAFLENPENNTSILTPDLIFDYFEPLLRREIYGGELHKVFLLAQNILQQIEEDELGSKIIKTLALIYMLEQFERLAPTKEEILKIYTEPNCPAGKIEKTIDNLIEKKFVIYLKRSNNFLQLKKNSGVDVRQKINDWLEVRGGKIAPKDILNAANFDSYIYPARYNEERAMTRFFAFKFISGGEIDSNTDWQIKSEKIVTDGIIYGVIPENEKQLESLKNLLPQSCKGYAQFIFVLPKKFKNVKKIAAEYAAVCQLKDNAAEDTFIFDEYEIIFEDLQEVISNFIHEYTRPENHCAIYIHDGEVLNIGRKSALTEKISQICDSVYFLTPKINNEMINKNEITAVAQNSRNKIVRALLANELDPNLGFSGSGQEVSIMRSTLCRTDILIDAGGAPKINLSPKFENFRKMLEVIENFVLSGGKNNFGELYEKLTAPKYHIGVRLGVIPIYLAAVLHNYRRQIIISDRFNNLPLSAEVLLQINSEPQNFSLQYLNWDSEKENYIKKIAETFAQYVIESERHGNAYDYAANAMRRWYIALPKFSKECSTFPNAKEISAANKKMIKLVKADISGADLLFKKLPAVFESENLDAVAENIVTAKEIFDARLDDLKNALITDTKYFLLTDKNIALAEKMSAVEMAQDWCRQLDEKIFEQVFSDGTDKFLKLLKDGDEDENIFIMNLAELSSGLKLENWNSKTFEKFSANVNKFIKNVENVQGAPEAENATYNFIFKNEGGTLVTKRFDKAEISPRGKLLFNKITSDLDSMGLSISDAEKRQVIIDILQSFC